MQTSAGITRQLREWDCGSTQAFHQLVELAYSRLSQQAQTMLRNERCGHTLQTRALVHEAYLRLQQMRDMQWQGRQHFFAMASSIMRRVLVDHARARCADKRGSGARQVTLEDVACSATQDLDLLALDVALTNLAGKDPVQARIVELRYFGGLTIVEIAENLSISPATVKRKWTLAQAILYRELSDADHDDITSAA